MMFEIRCDKVNLVLIKYCREKPIYKFHWYLADRIPYKIQLSFYDEKVNQQPIDFSEKRMRIQIKINEIVCIFFHFVTKFHCFFKKTIQDVSSIETFDIFFENFSYDFHGKATNTQIQSTVEDSTFHKKSIGNQTPHVAEKII